MLKNCSICELGGHFIPANRYGCYKTLSETVIYKCPDKQFQMNQRCRKLLPKVLVSNHVLQSSLV